MASSDEIHVRNVVERTMMRIGTNNETARWYAMVLGTNPRAPPTGQENKEFKSQVIQHCMRSTYLSKCLEDDHRLEFFTLGKVVRELDGSFLKHELYLREGPVSKKGGPNNPDVVECANELRRITNELLHDVVSKGYNPLEGYRRAAFQMMLELIKRVLEYNSARYDAIPWPRPGYIDQDSDLVANLIVSPRPMPGEDPRFVLPVLDALVHTTINVVDDDLKRLARETLAGLQRVCAGSPRYLTDFCRTTGLQ